MKNLFLITVLSLISLCSFGQTLKKDLKKLEDKFQKEVVPNLDTIKYSELMKIQKEYEKEYQEIYIKYNSVPKSTNNIYYYSNTSNYYTSPGTQLYHQNKYNINMIRISNGKLPY